MEKIIQDARNDPLLQSTLDIQSIIDSVDKTDMDYLGDRTLTDIANEIYDSILELGVPKEELSKYCQKLIEYRYVDQIYQLHRGKHVRWIRTRDSVMTNGGIVVDVKFLDNGTHVVCKNGPRFIQYKFDECLTFQKLSKEEQLLLSCYSIVNEEPKL
jgi:NDP-sugar pyrophosphorylase family protein